MDLKLALQMAIKPDLNLIYTERPFRVGDGWDFGWFCREHALHLFLVTQLLGFNSDMIFGDVVIKNYNANLSTIGAGGHMWCKVNDWNPVDVSISLTHIDDFPDIQLVFGKEGKNTSPYEIHYLQEAESSKLTSILAQQRCSVVFVERKVFDVDPVQLVKHPFSLLLPPPEGKPSFVDIQGDEIFDMITMHCFKLATGEAKPVSRYLECSEAIRRIKKWNGGATEKILRMLCSS